MLPSDHPFVIPVYPGYIRFVSEIRNALFRVLILQGRSGEILSPPNLPGPGPVYVGPGEFPASCALRASGGAAGLFLPDTSKHENHGSLLRESPVRGFDAVGSGLSENVFPVPGYVRLAEEFDDAPVLRQEKARGQSLRGSDPDPAVGDKGFRLTGTVRHFTYPRSIEFAGAEIRGALSQ